MAVEVRFQELGVVSPVRGCRDPVRGRRVHWTCTKRRLATPQEH